MDIIIGKKGKLGEQPHFYHVHDKHFRAKRKPPCYELPLAEIVEYMAAHPHDLICHEALARLIGSHGVRIEARRIWGGERDIGRCFTVDRDPHDPYSPVHLDEGFVELHLHHPAILLGDTQGHTRPNHPDEIKTIRAHLTAVLGHAGLEPNMDRLRKEFRPQNRNAIEGRLH